MPPRRSPRNAATAAKLDKPEQRPSAALIDAQNSFVNALSSRGRGGQIVEVVLPLRTRKRKAPTPEPVAPSPSAEGTEGSEDGDDDAPEPVSMTSGRKEAQEEEKRVREFEQTAATKRKETNRKRDQLLKERAEAQGGSRKKRTTANVTENAPAEDGDDMTAALNAPLPASDDAGEEQREAEARMERAMADAADEDEGTEDDEDEDVEMEGDPDDDATAVSADILENPTHTRLDNDLIEEEGSNSDAAPARPAIIPRHLPDHLFASAAAAMSEAQKAQRLRTKTKKTNKVKETEKKKKRKAMMKDLVVGSRTVRVLPSQPQPDTGAKSGSAAARFVRKSLHLTKPEGTAKKAKNKKGWERKDAHLTLSQGSSGPARGFARSSKQ